jgi:Domain of unknown function (DUF4251)
MRSSKLRWVVLTLFLTSYFKIQAQNNSETNKARPLKELIESKQYRFHPLSANTAKGKTIQITSEYFLMVNQDSLQVDLPYFGRSYAADYGTNDQGIQFNSVDFSYISDTTKKGGWEITIVPKNESKANKIFMSIGSGGYGSVNILSNSRQSISYYGSIEPIKK